MHVVAVFMAKLVLSNKVLFIKWMQLLMCSRRIWQQRQGGSEGVTGFLKALVAHTHTAVGGRLVGAQQKKALRR